MGERKGTNWEVRLTGYDYMNMLIGSICGHFYNLLSLHVSLQCRKVLLWQNNACFRIFFKDWLNLSGLVSCMLGHATSIISESPVPPAGLFSFPLPFLPFQRDHLLSQTHTAVDHIDPFVLTESSNKRMLLLLDPSDLACL